MKEPMNVHVNCECCGREMVKGLDVVTQANVCIKCRNVFSKLSRHDEQKEEGLRECEWAVVRRDWWGARRLGRVVSPTIKCGQEWTPILWEDSEDPDFFKTKGLVFFVTEADARQYQKGYKKQDEHPTPNEQKDERLRQDLSDLVWSNTNPGEEYWKKKVRDILSRHPDKAVEPLAVLADRKGKNIYPRKRIVGMVETLAWAVSVFNRCGRQKRVRFYGQSYAAAEAKARAYLEGMEDKKEGA